LKGGEKMDGLLNGEVTPQTADCYHYECTANVCGFGGLEVIMYCYDDEGNIEWTKCGCGIS
jgi:hypothetical protein